MSIKLAMALAVLVAGAMAGRNNFPAFDPNHAHCALETTLPYIPCRDIFETYY